jgi:hypothetical protein
MHPNAPIIKALKQQSEDVKREFNTRLTQVHVQHVTFSSFQKSALLIC